MAEQRKDETRPRHKTSEKSATGPRAHSRKRSRSRRAAPELAPVISGRYWVAVLAVVLLGYVPFSPLNEKLNPPEPVPEKTEAWHQGSRVRIGVTLITADYDRLACAHEQKVGEGHCGYKSESQPWPHEEGEPLDDNKAKVIQPYRTFPNNQLILIQGLWADPVLATRLHEEPSTLPEKKMSRFVVECDATFVGQMENPKLKWQTNGTWGTERSAMVATVSGCRLIEDA
jgi:hypothetical protein